MDNTVNNNTNNTVNSNTNNTVNSNMDNTVNSNMDNTVNNNTDNTVNSNMDNTNSTSKRKIAPSRLARQKVHMCYMVNQKKEPCSWRALSENKLYCKRHSIYEGVYNKEDIINLQFCSGCKNPFKNKTDENYKICEKCRVRGEKIRKENKEEVVKCIGITKNGTPCTNQAKENSDVCELHISWKRYKDAISSGKNMCRNWERGCFEIIDLDIKTCSKCRTLEKNKENTLNREKREKAIEYNKTNNNKMCVKCNKIVNLDSYKNSRCLECYETYNKVEQNRASKDPLLRKLYDYKSSASKRSINWNLTDKEAIEYFKNKCYYCTKLVGYNGIDRIDSKKNYSKENCVSCCKLCNIMKSNYNLQKFLEMITYLLSINAYINKEINNDYKKHFICGENSKYSKFIYEAKNRKINYEISKETYKNIIQQNCHYCKNGFVNGCRGIDRVNSKVGYICGNIVPCCYTCNIMKNIFSLDEFFHHLLKIYKHTILKEVSVEENTQTIQDKILSLCKNVKILAHEKFFQNKEFYENLMYNKNATLSDVSKIKIKLEFVENKKQLDIWNYYRKSISSLKKTKNSSLIGRQIYILVKDEITDKYLGILSLSSDYYSLDDRDRYIGWTIAEKNKKLKYIMNMSTCVPIQPFGFNFTGGKLLAMLAFSKEVNDYYYKKYNEPLLGITTTSLYGKSVQYDKLKELKFVGYTKGNSVKDIPSEVTKICNDYLKFEYGYNYKLSKKFIILQKTFDNLGISKEDILTSNPKGIYFGFTCNESKKLLCSCAAKGTFGGSISLNNTCACDIFQTWFNKYATNRSKSLSKNVL